MYKTKISQFIILCFLILLLPVSVSATDSDRAISLYEEGYSWYRKGDYFKSEDCLLKALEIEPNLWKAHYWLGKLYREMGELENALFHWEETERMNKTLAYRRIALTIEDNEYPAMAQKRKTEDRVRKALDHFNKAMRLIDEGHWEGGEEELYLAVETYPANQLYLITLARLLMDQNEWHAGINFYRKLLLVRSVKFEYFLEAYEQMRIRECPNLMEPYVKMHKHRFAGIEEFDAIEALFQPKEKKVTFEPEFIGRVIKRVGDKVIIDAGLSKGLSKNDEQKTILKAFKPGKILIHPESGEPLGRLEGEKIADLLLTRVSDNMSEALIKAENDFGVKAGDLIEF